MFTRVPSSEGVTPPALVPTPREDGRNTGGKVGRRLRRLLRFQATLEKEKGLPPSRWQRRLEFGEEDEATFFNIPASCRRIARLGEAKVSSPRRRSRVEDVQYTTPKQRPGYRGLEATRQTQLLVSRWVRGSGAQRHRLQLPILGKHGAIGLDHYPVKFKQYKHLYPSSFSITNVVKMKNGRVCHPPRPAVHYML